ncbi:unnamed protein product, partial [Sphacelaria rigidula]
NLVVRPDVLTHGASYTFRLSATNPQSSFLIGVLALESGFAEVTILVNSAPYGGYVDAAPRAGTAAIDTFALESLGWGDDADDLPLVFSFSVAYGESETTPLYSLSMFSTELPEWTGPLPVGKAVHNYTMSVAG